MKSAVNGVVGIPGKAIGARAFSMPMPSGLIANGCAEAKLRDAAANRFWRNALSLCLSADAWWCKKISCDCFFGEPMSENATHYSHRHRLFVESWIL